LPCETDDALPKKNFFVNIFPKKVGERGGERDETNFFRTLKKEAQKFFSG
jgi:hypothetical protein